jgi:serine/threonine-protein kinase
MDPATRMSAKPATACPNCGLSIEPDARFCGSCGAKVAPSAAVSAPLTDTITDTMAAHPAAAATPAPEPASMSASMSASTSGGSLDRLVGRTLNGRYVVQKKVGEGGFGAVYRGKQIATGREVALKILHPHNVSDPTVVARFRREAEACSKLHNAHSVTIYDFDEAEDGTLYLAMELVQGKSLQQVQRAEGLLPPRRVLGILDQVADALGEAHGQGIVHRDMKPENVMVERREDQDFVKVLDFGIAKIVSGYAATKSPALTAIGQTVGTLEFMSPEQLRGRPLDGRSDLYALGMMAYEMLTGMLPFHGAKNSTDVIQFHLQKPAPPPSRLAPDAKIPAVVDAVVLKMVQKEREDRHASAAELRAHIAKALGALDPSTVRNEAVRVAAVLGGLALLVAAAILLLNR